MKTDPFGDFNCINCGKQVVVNDFMGTKNRNHCPFCLHSKHVDSKVAGDRAAVCGGDMVPIGLTFKQTGNDKYGQPKQGELMIVHSCQQCGKISINRVAADDNNDQILALTSVRLAKQLPDIKLLDKSDQPKVKTLLFGKH